jgi:MYXO-CTERM domain-containing protein
VDLAAPGADLTAADARGGHKTVTGTSFASAIVSGAAALVRSAHPDWSAAQVRRALVSTANPGNEDLGAGIVDAGAAVAADVSVTEAPESVPTVWSAAATAAGGGLLGLGALLLRGRRRLPVRPRTMAG